MNRWAILAAVALVLTAAMAASAAHSVMIDPDVAITVDIPKFGLVLPYPSTNWSFTLTSNDQDPDDGFTFTAQQGSGTYKLRVWSNTNVTVTLQDGDINAGGTRFHPTYTFTSSESLNDANHVGGETTTLYISGAAKNGIAIDLQSFEIVVGAAPNAGTNITQFTPGNATGQLVITVAAS